MDALPAEIYLRIALWLCRDVDILNWCSVNRRLRLVLSDIKWKTWVAYESVKHLDCYPRFLNLQCATHPTVLPSDLQKLRLMPEVKLPGQKVSHTREAIPALPASLRMLAMCRALCPEWIPLIPTSNLTHIDADVKIWMQLTALPKSLSHVTCRYSIKHDVCLFPDLSQNKTSHLNIFNTNKKFMVVIHN